MSNLSTINSFVRTCLLLGFLGVVGYGGWFGYERYVKPGLQAEAALAEAAQLKAELAASLEKQSQLMCSWIVKGLHAQGRSVFY